MWFCENENSAPACTVVGMINQKQQFFESADNYYEMACKQQYALACFKRAVLAENRQHQELAKESYLRACEYGHQAACQKPKQ